MTGDISGLDDDYLSVEAARIPEGLVREADLLVIETTYCNSDHRQRSQQEQGIVETTRSVIARRGRVLVPAFGLGRAQEVVMILRHRAPRGRRACRRPREGHHLDLPNDRERDRPLPHDL